MTLTNSEAVVRPPLEKETPSDRFYRTVWRWHFYAGLFVIPFMLILGTTGIIYLFKLQLDTAMHHNLMFVQPSLSAETTMLSYKEQVQTAQQAYPQATVTQFTPNVAVNRSAEVVVATAEGRDLNVFVDPYAGKVLGVRDEERNLQAIARKIHGTLLIGDWGDYLIELAVSWALVLLVSGLYLWLPRKNISLMGTLIPRLCSKNKRIFWRDLHAVPGFYGVLLIGFLILTGLPWTGFWGDTFAQVWGRFPEKMWDNVPQSTLVTGSLNERGTLFVPWAAESMPMPVSTAIPNASSGSNSIASKNVGYDAMLVADSSGAMNGMSPVFDSIVALAIKEGHRLDLALRFQ